MLRVGIPPDADDEGKDEDGRFSVYHPDLVAVFLEEGSKIRILLKGFFIEISPFGSQICAEQVAFCFEGLPVLIIKEYGPPGGSQQEVGDDD